MIRKINILGHEVKIKYVSPRSKKLDGANGTYYLDKKEIYVNKDQDEIVIGLDLTHELLHCLIDIAGFNKHLTDKQEHKIIYSLEYVTYMFLKENTDFFKRK